MSNWLFYRQNEMSTKIKELKYHDPVIAIDDYMESFSKRFKSFCKEYAKMVLGMNK